VSEAVDAALLARMPLPPAAGGKEERGRILVVAGSRDVPGAALLAGMGALRVGAGKLQFQAPASIALALGIAMPEAMSVGLPETAAGGISPDAAAAVLERANQCSAVLIGPGFVNDDATGNLVAALLAGIRDCPIVLDAAAMMRLKDHADLLARHSGRVIVTPHAGEMAGILDVGKDEIEADPAETARRVSDRFGIVVILKGACSFIAAPDGRNYSCTHGHPGLGTSGSGDTLAGIIAGLLGRGASPTEAALWGVYLHGEAGNRLAASRGPLGYLAREIPGEIPAVLGELCG
jgi:ADP-dependent NAD(P)H-hydrate dehydratase